MKADEFDPHHPHFLHEAEGRVNEYREFPPAKESRPPLVFHTINLTGGVTPFLTWFDTLTFGRVKCQSNNYRLTTPVVTVGYGWYRPTRREFNTMTTYARMHVLRGGLLLAPLQQAITKGTPASPAVTSDPKAWEEFVLAAYGVKPAEWQKEGA